MKKLMMTLLLCSCMPLLPEACAQESTGRSAGPLYVQLYGGINKSANEHLPWGEFSAYPWSAGLFVGVGQELTPLWGWRAALRYNRNKGRNVPRCESSDTWSWSSVGLFADATFDLTDALTPQSRRKPDRLFNLKAFAGVGMSSSFGFDDVPLSYTHPYSDKSRVVPAGRVGIDATFRLSRQWRVGAELSHTLFTDWFNGVKANSPVDSRTNLSIGVTYVIGQEKKPQVPSAPIVYDNRLRAVPALPFVMPRPEDVKRRVLVGRAFLDFPVNKTDINPRYRRNPQELHRISSSIDSALFDKTTQVTSISLHGYASPESPYSNNLRLAKGRTAALMQYLCKRYRLSASLFHNEYTPEDWGNLRGFIAESGRRKVKGDIWYDDASILETPEAPASVVKYRDQLLDVIDRNIDPDEKENLLKQVAGGEPYSWLLHHVYPGLRHTDYIIRYVVRNYPVKQSRKLIYTHPEALSVKEMYLVAQSYDEGSDGWFEALLAAANQYPSDATANLNAACACVRMKRLTDAKQYLSLAGSSAQARYLSDIIRAMEGRCQWKMENGKVVITDNKQ